MPSGYAPGRLSPGGDDVEAMPALFDRFTRSALAARGELGPATRVVLQGRIVVLDRERRAAVDPITQWFIGREIDELRYALIIDGTRRRHG